MTIVSCVDVVYLFLPKLLNSHVLLFFFFFFNDTATTEIYTLSLHGRSSDLVVLDIDGEGLGRLHRGALVERGVEPERSEEHTSELQSRQYLVCRLLLEKK